MNKPVLVLLHGWGNNSSTWTPVIDGLRVIAPLQTLDLPGFGAAPALDDYSLETVLATLSAQLPERCVLVGWSLGAMLAVQLAARLPKQVLGVISLAANACFVARDGYPQAMAPAVNAQFNAQFAAQPQAALKLFAGLMAQGDANERQLLKQLRSLPGDAAINDNWLAALELLAQLDNRALLAQLRQPLLHILAEGDALVPMAAAPALQALNPQHQVAVLANAAHALHYSQPQQLLAVVQGFYAQWQAPDKKRIAHSFGKAAATYDSVADLQRNVGAQLLHYLPAHTEGKTLLDLGCGTGFFSAQLAARGLDVIALDIAQGMLQFARQQQGSCAHWLCGDGEQLPLASNSLDVVFSSLAIQWCSDTPQLMRELARVLKPGGQALLCTLAATLAELKHAWQQVDHYVHVNRFAPLASLQQAAAQAQLACIAEREAVHTLYFAGLRELRHSLKALGAQNMNPGQATGLTGRQRLQAFSAAYEALRVPQGLPVSYQVYYVVLQKALKPYE